ncbi:MAG: hypothetical protein IJV64_03360 [Oscillospiraceae bacterium]|nr:hypothetical protein [Oscillospiraceae bacterium]
MIDEIIQIYNLIGYISGVADSIGDQLGGYIGESCVSMETAFDNLVEKLKKEGMV